MRTNRLPAEIGRVAVQFLNDHPHRPLTAFWKSLTSAEFRSSDLPVAVASHPLCGIEAKSQALENFNSPPGFGSLPTGQGSTPLILSVYAARLDVASSLLEIGANVNAGTNTHRRALHLAAAAGNIDAMKMLLAFGAFIDADDVSNWTSLHWASTMEHAPAVSFLLSRGADVSARNNYGNTALHMAAMSGFTDVAKILLDEGASTNWTNLDGHTPKQLAQDEDWEDMVALLNASEAADCE